MRTKVKALETHTNVWEGEGGDLEAVGARGWVRKGPNYGQQPLMEKETCLDAGTLKGFCTSSEVLRYVDGTVTPHIPVHPLEEIDHGAFQQ